MPPGCASTTPSFCTASNPARRTTIPPRRTSAPGPPSAPSPFSPSATWRGRFFLNVSFFDPHSPYFDYPLEAGGLVDRAAIDPVRPLTAAHEPVPSGVAREREGFRRRYGRHSGGRDLGDVRHGYYASVAFLDRQVGRILAELERRGLAHNTLVLFVSDHGDMIGDYELITKGAYFYDPCTRGADDPAPAGGAAGGHAGSRPGAAARPGRHPAARRRDAGGRANGADARVAGTWRRWLAAKWRRGAITRSRCTATPATATAATGTRRSTAPCSTTAATSCRCSTIRTPAAIRKASCTTWRPTPAKPPTCGAPRSTALAPLPPDRPPARHPGSQRDEPRRRPRRHQAGPRPRTDAAHAGSRPLDAAPLVAYQAGAWLAHGWGWRMRLPARNALLCPHEALGGTWTSGPRPRLTL